MVLVWSPRINFTKRRVLPSNEDMFAGMIINDVVENSVHKFISRGIVRISTFEITRSLGNTVGFTVENPFCAEFIAKRTWYSIAPKPSGEQYSPFSGLCSFEISCCAHWIFLGSPPFLFGTRDLSTYSWQSLAAARPRRPNIIFRTSHLCFEDVFFPQARMELSLHWYRKYAQTKNMHKRKRSHNKILLFI